MSKTLKMLKSIKTKDVGFLSVPCLSCVHFHLNCRLVHIQNMLNNVLFEIRYYLFYIQVTSSARAVLKPLKQKGTMLSDLREKMDLYNCMESTSLNLSLNSSWAGQSLNLNASLDTTISNYNRYNTSSVTT